MSLVGKPSQYYSGFSPTQLPGCVLWLDAADSSTLTLSGSNVTQWNDKSGNATNATPLATAPVYSNNSNVVFTGSQLLTTTLSSILNTQTAFVIGSVSSSNKMDFLGVQTSAATTGIQLLVDNYLPKVTIFGGALVANGTTVSSNTRFMFETTYNAGSTSFVYSNGTETGTKTSSTTLTGTGTITVGGYYYTSSPPVADELLIGTINEILIYNAVLTTAHRQQVEGYLAWKWGLSSSIPATHPFKLLRPFGRPFSPLDVSGCALWLDAADQSTVTLSGTNVTQWNDKSGAGTNATAGTSTYPVYQSTGGPNSMPIITLRGSNDYFTVSNNFSPAQYPDLCYLIAMRIATTQPGTSGGILSTHNGTTYARSLGIGDTGNYLQQGVFGNAYNVVGGNVTESWMLAGLQYYSNTATAATMYQNGTATTGYAPSTGSNTAGFKIGAYTASVLNANVDVGEILVYGASLTLAQRQLLEGYLANKWSTISTLPATHPFKRYPPLNAPFSPVQIPGCALWLDAADSSTLTLTGSNVTQWNDKSGNGRNPAGSGGTILTTINGNTAITLNGTDTYFYSSNAAAVNNTPNLSAFVVATFGTGMLSTQRLLGFGDVDWNTSTNCVAFEKASGAERVGWERGGSYASGSVALTTPVSFLGSVVFTSSNVNQWVNSTSNSSGTYSFATFNYSLFNIGRYSGGSLNWKGAIAEVIAYNAALTTAQRQQVEGYLAQKWKLATKLPVSHPYKLIAP